MKLVSAKEMLDDAVKGHYAVGHFNLNNMESVRAFLLAAQEVRSPIILGVSGGTAKYMGGYRTITDMVQGFMDFLDITVPVALHVDHGKYSEALDAIEKGFSSVMFDGSSLPIEENIEKTREVVRLAHAKGNRVLPGGSQVKETPDPAGRNRSDSAVQILFIIHGEITSLRSVSSFSKTTPSSL